MLDSREPGEINASFGLPRAHQYASGMRSKREDMSGSDKILSLGIISYGGLNGSGAIRCGNTGGHPFAGFNGNREVGAKTGAVTLCHQREIKPVSHFR